MSDHITTELVTAVSRRAVEGHPLTPTAWESVDPLTRHMLMERAAAVLADAIPVLIEHGWTPPKEAQG